MAVAAAAVTAPYHKYSLAFIISKKWRYSVNNKSNGSGCLTAILVFSFFAGNIFLFGGDLGSGGDLEGNSIAIIMAKVQR